MLRPLVVTIAVATLLSPTIAARAVAPTAPGAAAAQAGTSIKGTWVGIVSDDTGARKPYQVTVQVKRSHKTHELKATVDYPYCSGVWTFVRAKNGVTQVFTETITHDPGIKSCVSKLRVQAKRTQAGDLYVKWVHHQRTDHMIAQRAT